MHGTTLLASFVSFLPSPQQPFDGRPILSEPPGPPSYVERSSGLRTPTLDGGVMEVEVGDVDGDGHPDLVSVGDHGSPFVNTQQHGVMVWFGNGAGEWSVFQNGNFGYGGVALGDVDADGAMDVGYGVHHAYSSTDFGDQLLEVARGDGSGRVWTPWDDGLATNGESWGMAGTDFADVDEDGDLDVASVSFGCCAGVHVYLNQGDGTWLQSFGFNGGNSSSELLLADVDNDGHVDLVPGHQNGNVYLGDGAGDFVPASAGLPVTFGGPSGFDLGDVDGDGVLELALQSGGGAAVFEWNGTRWARMETRGLPASGRFQGVQLADMDGDGLLDAVLFGRRDGVVFLGDGTGGFFPVAGFFTPASGNLTVMRAHRDVDHNGRPDVFVVDEEGSTFSSRNVLHCFVETSVPVALSARIVAPGPNRVLRAGSVRFVDWLSAVPRGLTSSVDLDLSTSGPSGPWTAIAAALPDNGRYQWVVPATPSDACHLRITVSAGSRVTRTVSAAFRIL